MKNDFWFVIAAMVGGAGGIIGAVMKDWACALVGAGVVLIALALLL